MQTRLNRYTCEICGDSIITIDRELGVTPMFIACRAPRDAGQPKCKGMMISSMYQNVAGTPSFEWRKPTKEENAALDIYLREEHVDRGGLLLYPIEETKGQS